MSPNFRPRSGRLSTFRASSDLGLVFPPFILGCTVKGTSDADAVVAHKTAGLREFAPIQIRRAVLEKFVLTYHERAGLLE